MKTPESIKLNGVSEALIQGSEDWLLERLGYLTASNLSKALAKTKSGVSLSRKAEISKIIAERLSGKPLDTFTNFNMQRGNEEEPFARMAYEIFIREEVQQIGFVKHKAIENFGASPDGLVGTDGLVEIKCPQSNTHIDYLRDNKVPGKYKLQMIAQCLCTGRKWVDFVSFDSRLGEDLELFVIRYTPTKKELEETEKEVIIFLNEVEETLKNLREKHGKKH